MIRLPRTAMVMHPVVRQEVLRDDHIERLRTACTLLGDIPCRTYAYLTENEALELGAVKAGLAELLSQSDVVTLHAPLLAETREMIGTGELALMKDGATLINTARGALVDQGALTLELANGRLFALLDTTLPEDLPADSPLFELDNVVLTPHIAGAQGREGERLADLVADELERFRRGDPLRHAVRIEHLPRLA